ncbi:MAG: aspartate aminotransferase family protein [Solirubrobacterales bacterium]
MTKLPDIYGENSAQTPNYARFDVEFTRGEGAYLFDTEGTRYLDLLCGLGVTSLGHCEPRVVAAIEAQASTLLHTSNLFWTQPAEQLARRLTELTFGANVFLCNSGAEANEAAIKLARANAYNAGNPAREIVVLERAFHGRTFGALSATPQEDKQAPFAPLVHGFKTVPHDDADAVAQAIDVNTCAVMIEPVQGEGGVYLVPDDVLVAAREACDAVGALLIFDEVQCGLGRTGSLFAYEQTPVVPDVMTLAKALAGGLPIGAMVVAEPFATALRPGYHGSTFGGNPVSAAAALAVLEILSDPATLERVNEIAGRMRSGLKRHGEVQGRGLMIGLDIETATEAPDLVKQLLFERQMVANATGPQTLRFLPPFVLTDDEVDLAVDAVSSVLR